MATRTINWKGESRKMIAIPKQNTYSEEISQKPRYVRGIALEQYISNLFQIRLSIPPDQFHAWMEKSRGTKECRRNSLRRAIVWRGNSDEYWSKSYGHFSLWTVPTIWKLNIQFYLEFRSYRLIEDTPNKKGVKTWYCCLFIRWLVVKLHTLESIKFKPMIYFKTLYLHMFLSKRVRCHIKRSVDASDVAICP